MDGLYRMCILVCMFVLPVGIGPHRKLSQGDLGRVTCLSEIDPLINREGSLHTRTRDQLLEKCMNLVRSRMVPGWPTIQVCLGLRDTDTGKIRGKSGQLVTLSLKFYPIFLNTCISKNQRTCITFVFLLVKTLCFVGGISFSDCRMYSTEMMVATLIRYCKCGSLSGEFCSHSAQGVNQTWLSGLWDAKCPVRRVISSKMPVASPMRSPGSGKVPVYFPVWLLDGLVVQPIGRTEPFLAVLGKLLCKEPGASMLLTHSFISGTIFWGLTIALWIKWANKTWFHLHDVYSLASKYVPKNWGLLGGKKPQGDEEPEARHLPSSRDSKERSRGKGCPVAPPLG